MDIGFSTHDSIHHRGESTTHPIEPLYVALGAFLLLAGMSRRATPQANRLAVRSTDGASVSPQRRRALPTRRIAARWGASNCRI